jgi:hypothetical protein
LQKLKVRHFLLPQRQQRLQDEISGKKRKAEVSASARHVDEAELNDMKRRKMRDSEIQRTIDQHNVRPTEINSHCQHSDASLHRHHVVLHLCWNCTRHPPKKRQRLILLKTHLRFGTEICTWVSAVGSWTRRTGRRQSGMRGNWEIGSATARVELIADRM